MATFEIKPAATRPVTIRPVNPLEPVAPVELLSAPPGEKGDKGDRGDAATANDFDPGDITLDFENQLL